MRSTRPRYIAVEGPIGAGKSSLAEILGEALSARVIRENPEENPFLGPFYKDRRRHAMSAQLFFLLQRYAQQGELAQGDLFSRGGVVSDYLFAKDRLFATLNLSDDEMALYDRIYQMLKVRTVTPDLVVYLQARKDVLLERIRKRGRSEERPIRAEYVEEVARAYAAVLLLVRRGAVAGGQRVGHRFRQQPRPPARAAGRHRQRARRRQPLEPRLIIGVRRGGRMPYR